MEKRKSTHKDISTFFSKKSKNTVHDDTSVPSTSDSSEIDKGNSQGPTNVPVDEPGSFNVQEHIKIHENPNYDDVGLFNRSKLTNLDKIEILEHHFRPDRNYTFPLRQFKKQSRKFQFNWLKDFWWLVYSKCMDGGYCLPCFLFASKPDGRGCQFGTLIEKPFTDFKKGSGKDSVFINHEKNSFHKDAIVIYEDRKYRYENPDERIDNILDKKNQEHYETNKAALGSIIDCIIFLGHQGPPLRGHRDNVNPRKVENINPDSNKGNLQELIQFRSKNDEILQRFIKNCPKNASYLSNTIQNEILEIIADIIRESISCNVSEEFCPFFSIIADELSDDIANKHIMSLCIRYIKFTDGEVENIGEGVIDLVYTERGTAAHLKKVIKDRLSECGFNPAKVRGQAYDTTSAMASEGEGVQGLFKKDVPRAIYTPCHSHRLNLVIASASKLQQIRNCIAAINEAFLFLDKSHKRQGYFERIIAIVHGRDDADNTKQKKLKGLCKTRWVERFETFQNFTDLLPALITMCETINYPHLYEGDEEINLLIGENWDWSSDTKTRSQGILGTFGNFENIVCLIVLKNGMSPLREITIKLQMRDIDIRYAYTLVSSVKAEIGLLRTDIDDHYDTWYEEIKDLSQKIGTEEKMGRTPRVCLYRATHPADDPKNYFKRSIVIPFMDEIKQQLSDRFTDSSITVVQALTSLMPKIIYIKEVSDLPGIVKDLLCTRCSSF